MSGMYIYAPAEIRMAELEDKKFSQQVGCKVKMMIHSFGFNKDGMPS